MAIKLVCAGSLLPHLKSSKVLKYFQVFSPLISLNFSVTYRMFKNMTICNGMTKFIYKLLHVFFPRSDSGVFTKMTHSVGFGKRTFILEFKQPGMCWCDTRQALYMYMYMATMISLPTSIFHLLYCTALSEFIV